MMILAFLLSPGAGSAAFIEKSSRTTFHSSWQQGATTGNMFCSFQAQKIRGHCTCHEPNGIHCFALTSIIRGCSDDFKYGDQFQHQLLLEMQLSCTIDSTGFCSAQTAASRYPSSKSLSRTSSSAGSSAHLKSYNLQMPDRVSVQT